MLPIASDHLLSTLTQTNCAFSFPHRFEQINPDNDSRTPTPTWDSHLLQILDAKSTISVPGPAVFFFGCCHRGCQNLQGGSEALLRLRKCGGCSLARCVCPHAFCILLQVLVAPGFIFAQCMHGDASFLTSMRRSLHLMMDGVSHSAARCIVSNTHL